ncbi:iron-containing redox enzyme family protein [Streptomyces sp. PmtG]
MTPPPAAAPPVPASPPPAPGERIDAALALLRPGLRRVLQRVWDGPEPALVYPEFLHLTHQIVRASVPLLTDARDRCAGLARDGGDPVAARLLPYWERHIEEERGHDQWVCEDLAALGHDPDEVWRRPPSPDVAALCGAPYYWIRHVHPVCLLGYLAVLEGSPPHPDVAGLLGARTGYPRAAFRTLSGHAAADVGHGREVRALLDALPLSERQTAAVALCALHTTRSALRVFGGLAAAHGAPANIRGRGI